MFRKVFLLALISVVGLCTESFAYQLVGHPRIFVNRAGLTGLARRSRDVLSSEYAVIKKVADQAVAEGIQAPRGRFRPPMDMVCAGICYLVERELGHDPEPYAATIKRYWGDGSVLNLEGDGYFGFHGMVYDWIFDSLSPEQRKTFGDSLGQWLRYYTDTPEIVLKNGHWWYNQTWGPAHLNTPNTRDGIAPLLPNFLSPWRLPVQARYMSRTPGPISIPGPGVFLMSAFRRSMKWAGSGRKAWATAATARWLSSRGLSRPGAPPPERICSAGAPPPAICRR